MTIELIFVESLRQINRRAPKNYPQFQNTSTKTRRLFDDEIETNELKGDR